MQKKKLIWRKKIKIQEKQKQIAHSAVNKCVNTDTDFEKG